MKAVVADFNQEKALVGAFSVITNLRMELFEALVMSAMRGMMHVIRDGIVGRGSDTDREELHHELNCCSCASCSCSGNALICT